MEVRDHDTSDEATLTARGVGAGFVGLLPVALASVPFGVTFGAAALAKGVAPWLAVAMSMSVFAGASQFAALDAWTANPALLPLLLTTFAVNVRHLALGAALSSWLRRLSRGRRFAAVALLSDANWTQAVEARERGGRDVGVLVGGGLALWLCWSSGTVVGIAAGSAAGDLSRFGADVLMTSYFAGAVVTMRRGASDVAPVLVSAAVAVAAAALLPPGWHVLAGGVAGGIVGGLGRD